MNPETVGVMRLEDHDWCLQHEAIWTRLFEECDDPDMLEPCLAVPLYIGLPA